jgi:SAM-dependent methyltransferase
MSSRRVRPIEETEAAWVPEYFGDDYLRLYQFPEERTGPEVAYLRQTLAAAIPPAGRVLDLACGQGRHAIPLAAAGYRLTGLDIQANLLREAACQAQAHEVPLALVRGDMRRLPFAPVFDAVLCLFSAFGYFDDAENAGVLAEMAAVLRPGGLLVLDVANRDALLRQAQPRSWKRLPDGTVVISEWTWDVRSGRYTHWQLLVHGTAQRSFTHTVRLYSCTELEALCTAAGFTVEGIDGGFRGEALDLQAPRTIVRARKRV